MTPAITPPVRPMKQGNVRTYQAEVAALAPNDVPVLDAEVDGDLDTVYDAVGRLCDGWNALTTLPPSGAAGGDLAGSSFPNPVVAAGAITADKIAAGIIPTTLPPSGAAGGDLAGSTYPAPIIGAAKVTRAKTAADLWLPPVPAGADVGKVLSVASGPTLAYTAPPGGPPTGLAGGDLAGSSYPAPAIAAGVVTGSKIAALAIGTGHIVDGQVTAAKLAPDAKPWTIVGGFVAPTDTAKNVAIGPTRKTQLAATLDLTDLSFNWYGSPGYDSARASWLWRLDGAADKIFGIRRSSGDVVSFLFGFTSAGDMDIQGGTATKAGGGPWAAPSDRRTKKNVADYTAGLDAVTRLRPVSFAYNGLGGTTDDGKTYHGLLADEVLAVMPEMVTTRSGKLNAGDEVETELYQLNTGPLLFALVRAVQELATRLAALEAPAPA